MNHERGATKTERERADDLQRRLGIGVYASGKGFAIVDYDALEKLAQDFETDDDPEDHTG